MRALILWLLLALPLGGVRAQAVDDGPDVLRLRPGDAVRVQVGGVEGFTCGGSGCEFVVDAEGTVLLPVVGLVEVAGLPFDRVRERIRSDLAERLLEPEASVTPVMRIAVLGEVRQPGLLRVDPTYTVAEVLAAAGGLGPDADRSAVVLLRDDGTRRVSLEAGAETRVPVRPGDQILVGRRSWLSRNATAVLSVAGSVLAAIATSLILR